MRKIQFKTFNDFLKDIILLDGEIFNLRKENSYIFRGESSLEFELLPVALRPNGHKKVWNVADLKSDGLESEFTLITGEAQVLSSFFKICDENNLYIPNVKIINNNFFLKLNQELLLKETKWLLPEFYELAGLAQHYGLPTRLLDWSKDLFVSLYFATIGALKGDFSKDDNIVLWMLNINDYHNLNSPLKIIKPPYFGNPNLAAQKGLFTLWEIDKKAPKLGTTDLDKKHNKNFMDKAADKTPLNKLIEKNNLDKNGEILYKIEIPHSECITIYKYLNSISYNASRLFPGYNGVKQQMEEDIYLFKE